MDHKRKASTSNGAGSADADDRAAKRRKVPVDFDLSKGETSDSTTQYGLAFLEQIRRTADKNGRLVAGYFETLIPREGNAAYYKATRMPISLSKIETKLNNREFANLSELESYFKRMVSNAKEFYPRNSQVFEDAERVRKALSNYMTKTNPAYNVRGYTAVATPLPPDGAEEDAEDDEPGAEAEADAEAEAEVEAEAEDNDEEMQEDEQDADGEVDADGEEDEAEDDEDDEDDDDAQGEDDDDEDEDATDNNSKRAPIIVRRRGPGRPPKNPALHAQKVAARGSAPLGKPDVQYEDVPYKGLSFQEAQEKLVEEMLRKKEDDYEEAYFEVFINLPPRSLKDYYKHITEPLSIKKLQKFVKGVHGRNDTAGTSDFKSWNAFEEKSSLLWKNAYYYNEEGSEIYDLAKELEDYFYEELRKAKEAVQEPQQPKIKLRVPPTAEPPTGVKRITIHVGGRGGSADSPAPPTAQSAGSQGSEHATNGNGAPRPAVTPAIAAALEMARSASAASPSPSVLNAVKREDIARVSPVVTPGLAAVTPNPLGTPGVMNAQFQPIPGTPQVNGIRPQPKQVWDQKYRAPGKGASDALISNLRIQTHPMLNLERRFLLDLPPHEKETQQSATIHMPANHLRVQIIPTIPAFLEEQQRQYKLWVLINRQPLAESRPAPGQILPPGAKVFEAQLQAGVVNMIEVHMVAALPKDQKTPDGLDAELELLTVLTNVVRN